MFKKIWVKITKMSILVFDNFHPTSKNNEMFLQATFKYGCF